MGIGDQQTQQRFPYGYDSVFAGLISVVHANPKFSLKSQDPVIGRIVVSAGMTAFSWGEKVSIAVERVDEASTMVTIASALKVGVNLFGAQQNSANLEGLIQQLSSYLQQRAVPGQVQPPSGDTASSGQLGCNVERDLKPFVLQWPHISTALSVQELLNLLGTPDEDETEDGMRIIGWVGRDVWVMASWDLRGQFTNATVIDRTLSRDMVRIDKYLAHHGRG